MLDPVEMFDLSLEHDLRIGEIVLKGYPSGIGLRHPHREARVDAEHDRHAEGLARAIGLPDALHFLVVPVKVDLVHCRYDVIGSSSATQMGV